MPPSVPIPAARSAVLHIHALPNVWPPGRHCRAAVGALVAQPPCTDAAGLCLAVDKEPPTHPHPPICRATLCGACRTGGPSVLPSPWGEHGGARGHEGTVSAEPPGCWMSSFTWRGQVAAEPPAGDHHQGWGQRCPRTWSHSIACAGRDFGLPCLTPSMGHRHDVPNPALCTSRDGASAPLGALHHSLSPLTGKCHPHSPPSLLLLLQTPVKALLHLSHPRVLPRAGSRAGGHSAVPPTRGQMEPSVPAGISAPTAMGSPRDTGSCRHQAKWNRMGLEPHVGQAGSSPGDSAMGPWGYGDGGTPECSQGGLPGGQTLWGCGVRTDGTGQEAGHEVTGFIITQQ